MYKNINQIKRRSPEDLLKGLKAENNPQESALAGLRLVAEAKEYGLCMRDFLTLAIDPRMSDNPRYYDGLDGFESALLHLNLPFRDDFKNGITLQAASNTFQTYPGTRAMFPEVVDQMLRWKNRQDQIENVSSLVAQSRTINGTELISTAVEDDSNDRGTYTVAEGARIPVRTIRTSESSVRIYKHGSGIRTTYEFERRAGLDILTPFAARIARELEISKVRAATSVLVNGDGVNGAAPVVAFSDFDGVPVDASNPLSGQYKALAKWLISRADAGTPIDLVVGNIDMYIELLFMFMPTLPGGRSEIRAMVAEGAPGMNVALPLLGTNANFALSRSMPANRLLGYTKAETLEELVEAGSNIAENERSIQNQTVTYVRSENTGYKLAFGDTRSILNLEA